MSKLYFDSFRIENVILPEIVQVQEDLSLLNREIKNITVPVGSSSFQNGCSILAECSTEIKKLRGWLDKNIKNMEQTMKDMNSFVDDCEKLEIKPRVSKIRN